MLLSRDGAGLKCSNALNPEWIISMNNPDSLKGFRLAPDFDFGF